MASLNETIAALDRLPALPATTIQLISMLAGDGRETDLHEVEKIVSRDEAVAASVLRRANSAAFGMRGRVAGISDAIRRLGTRELCRIALETQTSGLLANAGRSYGLRRGSLSQSALGGAVAADALARAHTSSHRIDREVAFVATLLRDIGKLAIDAVAGADALEKIAAAADGKPIVSISSSRMSFDSRLDNLDKLIKLLTTVPAYAPNEADLKVTALTTLYNDLKTKNSAAVTAETALKSARIARADVLYKPTTGLVTTSLDVKTYIKSVYGSTSPQYKMASGLKFVEYN